MDTKVGQRIKVIRSKFKITQKDFASELGVTQANISAIEKGIYNASLPLIKLICIKYKINEEWLLEGNGNMYYFPDEWGTRNTEDLLKKYEAMKILLENNIDLYSSDHDNVFSIIESFSCFVSLTAAAKLSKQNVKTYFKQIETLMVHLEKYVFQCSMLDKKEKANYERLYRLGINEDKTKKIIFECIDKVTETYRLNSYKEMN